MRRLLKSPLLAVPAILVAGTASAAFWADNEPENVVALGGFEQVAVSLRLPAVSPYPLVAGGWGARGDDDSIRIVQSNAWEGDRALQIDVRRDAPAHVIQDIPLGTRSFWLEFAAMRLRGRQSLRLFGSWDRRDPVESPILEIGLGPAGLRIITPDGSWVVEAALPPASWQRIDVIADARTGQLQILVDEQLRATVPAILPQAPRTLMLGGDGDRSARYRYDGLRVRRLADVELAGIRRETLRWLAGDELPYVIEHLDAAAVALSRGLPPLAVPELRAALERIDRTGASAEVESVAAATAALVDLLAAS